MQTPSTHASAARTNARSSSEWIGRPGPLRLRTLASALRPTSSASPSWRADWRYATWPRWSRSKQPLVATSFRPAARNAARQAASLSHGITFSAAFMRRDDGRSAVTCHRFWRFGDLSPKQGRVQRPARVGRLPAFDGDKSPAESADKSTHSKVVAASPRWVDSYCDREKFCSPARIFAAKEHKERKSNCLRLCDLCVLLRQSSVWLRRQPRCVHSWLARNGWNSAVRLPACQARRPSACSYHAIA